METEVANSIHHLHSTFWLLKQASPQALHAQVALDTQGIQNSITCTYVRTPAASPYCSMHQKEREVGANSWTMLYTCTLYAHGGESSNCKKLWHHTYYVHSIPLHASWKTLTQWCLLWILQAQSACYRKQEGRTNSLPHSGQLIDSSVSSACQQFSWHTVD